MKVLDEIGEEDVQRILQVKHAEKKQKLLLSVPIKKNAEEVVMMYQIQNESENEFHSEDLVLWYSHVERGALPIPGVVVRQREYDVIIRTRVDGTIREIAVSPDELVKR